jgi:hypothetical protein
MRSAGLKSSKNKVLMMNSVIKKVGFSGWDGESWTTYRLFDRFWLHVNHRHRYPFVSFKEIPF